MREIKFKGKRKDNGEWVYGHYIVCDYKTFIVDKECCSSTYDNGRSVGIDYDELIEVISETVGQFTGLKDKNGTDLDWWEGDKFRIDGHLYAIVLDKGCFWFDGIDMPYRYTADSVSRRPNGNVPNKIGTIHDEEEAHANRS